MFNKLRIVLIFIILNNTLNLFAQNSVSPYSMVGLGDLKDQVLIQNQAMGGIGTGTPSLFFINAQNPAWLSLNNFTSFDFAFNAEYRKIKSEGYEDNSGTGALQYLTMAFPVGKKYTINAGIMPFSNVNYSFTTINKVINSNDYSILNNRGEGGLNNIFFSQGVQVHKNLSLGLKVAYIFGSIKKYESVELLGVNNLDILENYKNTNYKTPIFVPGIAFRKEIKTDNFLNLGATYQFKTKFNTSELEIFQRLNSGTILSSDTLYNKRSKNAILPMGVSGGISYEKLYKYTIGFDVDFQKWSEFSTVGDNDVMKDRLTLSIGGQYIPNINALSGYLNRVIYKSGLSYTQSQVYLNNKQINEFGINFGVSLPLAGLSFFNMTLTAGQRGASGNTLNESFYRVQLGVSLNDRWFIRRKYD